MPFLKAFEELARLRVWLFLYATRLVEFVNALLIIGFSTSFLVDSYDGHIDMYDTVGYSDFAVMTVWHWGGVWAFGLCQIIAMCFSSRRSNKASAILSIASSVLWAIVAGAFATSTRDFITTAPYIYTIWAVVTCFTGYELLTRCKKHGGD